MTGKSNKYPLSDAHLTKFERMSNFELLRIVCLLLIIAGHLVMWHEFNSVSVERIVRCGVRPFFSVAVNCFVLISGWFGISLRFRKILSLNNTLTFWTLLLCGLALIVGLHEIDLRRDILMLVPLLTRKYWFITVYAVLCLLAPYLNVLVNALSKPDFKKLLATCVCLFVLLQTSAAFLNFDSVTMDSGYGIVNFIVLYMFGRYMRLHAVPQRSSSLYFGVYFVLMAACGVVQIAYSSVLGFEFTTLISYDTFFVFFGALALFCAFSRLSFRNRYINLSATACFAVYVIHFHPWTGQWVFENLIGLESLGDLQFMLAIFSVPLFAYLCCFVLEETRILIFKMAGRCLAMVRALIQQQNP